MKKVRSAVIAFLIVLGVLGIASPALSQDYGFFNSPESFFGFESSVEIGFLGFFSHKVQFGESGTYFDYVKDGGQDVWFPFRRLSGEILLGSRHRLVFLVQPIDIRTEMPVPAGGLTVVDASFEPGTAIELRYGFDFYRLSYLYDFFKDPRNELAVGASLQIRDAVITFSGTDDNGSNFDIVRSQRDVGPVPALKFRAKYYLNDFVWLGSEIDGIYAAGRGATGSFTVDPKFVGAIIDASLRAGFTPRPPVDVFLNLRYLAGGAEGTDENDPNQYVKNWLHAFSVSLGVTVR
jgi:hypothetical protein